MHVQVVNHQFIDKRADQSYINIFANNFFLFIQITAFSGKKHLYTVG